VKEEVCRNHSLGERSSAAGRENEYVGFTMPNGNHQGKSNVCFPWVHHKTRLRLPVRMSREAGWLLIITIRGGLSSREPQDQRIVNIGQWRVGRRFSLLLKAGLCDRMGPLTTRRSRNLKRFCFPTAVAKCNGLSGVDGFLCAVLWGECNNAVRVVRWVWDSAEGKQSPSLKARRRRNASGPC